MRKVILYIAVSLDGYIADSEGSVEWISGQDKNVEMEDTFTPFFSGVEGHYGKKNLQPNCDRTFSRTMALRGSDDIHIDSSQ